MSDNLNIMALQKLELAINYSFQDISLLVHALTHRSLGSEHNERLEFLGDSILGMIIAKRLFELFPDCTEGELTRMRSALVRETTLAEMAREFSLGDCLRLGPGELKTGGARRDSLLSDAMESIIAAIFLDSGMDFSIVYEVVLKWFSSRLININPNISNKDAKSALQELLQSKKKTLPIYKVESITGADNNQRFDVSVSIDFLQEKFYGYGTSRRKAEQMAADKALAILSTMKM